MSASTPYQLLTAIKKALTDSGSFQHVGYFPEDVKKAIGSVQNTLSANYASCIIEDGDEHDTIEYMVNGFDEIEYNVGFYFFMSRGKGTIIKKLHDYEKIIKDIMYNAGDFGLTVNFTRFMSTEKGQPTGEIDETNMIGYSDGLVGRKLNYTINMRVAHAGNC